MRCSDFEMVLLRYGLLKDFLPPPPTIGGLLESTSPMQVQVFARFFRRMAKRRPMSPRRLDYLVGGLRKQVQGKWIGARRLHPVSGELPCGKVFRVEGHDMPRLRLNGGRKDVVVQRAWTRERRGEIVVGLNGGAGKDLFHQMANSPEVLPADIRVVLVDVSRPLLVDSVGPVGPHDLLTARRIRKSHSWAGYRTLASYMEAGLLVRTRLLALFGQCPKPTLVA